MKAYIDNWRWADVPFYLRAGKRLPKRATDIFVHFRPAPNPCSKLKPLYVERAGDPHPARRRYLAQVLESATGPTVRTAPVTMEFLRDGVRRRLSRGVRASVARRMLGDPTLFLGSRFVQRSWEFVQGILINGRPTREFPWSLTRPEPGGLKQPTI